jgi:ribosomal protein S18 acetylase RimI-like enzyme
VSDVIRQLEPDDVEAFRAIRLEALQDSPEAFGGDFAHESRQPIESFLEQITRSAVFGAFADGVLRGVVGLFWDTAAKRRHQGHLYTVYIRPEARGTGVGLPLIEAALEHAQSRGLLQVLLGVAVHNAPAIALYRKAGFEIYGTEPRSLHVNGRYIDEHMMVRFLDRDPVQPQGTTESDRK